MTLWVRPVALMVEIVLKFFTFGFSSVRKSASDHVHQQRALYRAKTWFTN